MDFSNTEKLDILLKDSFNVPSTNENIAWYLETNANYNTWTNGSDILLDEIPTTVDWNNADSLTGTEMSNLYGLSTLLYSTTVTDHHSMDIVAGCLYYVAYSWCR